MRAAPLIPCGRSPMPPVFHRGTTSSAEVNLKSRHRRAREFAPVIVHQHAATENLPRFVFGERVGRRPRARGGGPSRRIVPNRNANLSAMPGRPSPTHPSAAMRSIALPPGLLGTGAITAAIVTGLRSESGPRPAIPPLPCAPPTSRSSTPATRWSSPSASLPDAPSSRSWPVSPCIASRTRLSAPRSPPVSIALPAPTAGTPLPRASGESGTAGRPRAQRGPSARTALPPIKSKPNSLANLRLARPPPSRSHRPS